MALSSACTKARSCNSPLRFRSLILWASPRWALSTTMHWLTAKSLRRQALDEPRPIVLQAVAQAVVQAIRLATPELEDLRDHPIAAPERRPRDGPARKFLLQFTQPRFQLLTALDDSALR